MDKKIIYDSYLDNNYRDVNIGSFSDYESYKKTLLDSVGDILRKQKKSSSVLELGCGSGRMAYVFNELGFKNYVGVDLSNQELEIARKNFKKYDFFKEDILKYLDKTTQKYDIIMMYHVFEHLTRNEGFKVLKEIKRVLNSGGIFINVMPNASAYFNSSSMFYTDITHERIYNENSFKQFLISAGFNKIIFRNHKIGKSIFQRLIHKLFLKIFELFIQVLGYRKYNIYTSSMITIARK